MFWEVEEILRFNKLYRAKSTLIISDKEIITIWITISESKNNSLSIVKADNWELINNDIKLLLIKELKYKIKEVKNENK